MALRTFGLAAVTLTLNTSCGLIEWYDYTKIASIKDNLTGKYVELGWINNFSTGCHILDIYETDLADRSSSSMPSEPLTLICDIPYTPDGPKLTFEEGCFTLRVEYYGGGPYNTSWRDPDTGHEICIEVIRRY